MTVTIAINSEICKGKQVASKVKELSSLNKQQLIFSHRMEVTGTAVKGRYLFAKKKFVASKPCSDGEFVETC